MTVGDSWGMRPPHMKNSAGGSNCWKLPSVSHRASDPFCLARLGWEFHLSAGSGRGLGNFCPGPNSDQLGKVAWQSECDRNSGRKQQRHPGVCESWKDWRLGSENFKPVTTRTLIQLIEHRLWAGSLLGTGTTTCNRQHPSSREAYVLQQANKWTESFQIVKKATPTVKQVMGKCWGWSESRSGGQGKPSWGRGYLSWNSSDEKEPAYKKHVMRTTSKHKGMLGRSGLVWSRTQK